MRWTGRTGGFLGPAAAGDPPTRGLAAALTRRGCLVQLAGVACSVAAPQAATAAASLRIVAPDWAAAESLLALGVVPLGVSDAAVYRQWLPDLPLPPEVIDLGSRPEPNLELISWLRPERIFISNWQANLLGQFERIAATELISIIAPPASPLENARTALRQVAGQVGRQAEAETYLSIFDQALTGYAARLRGITDKSVLVGVLHENGRQLYAYGPGSWVHEALVRLGLHNALTAPTSRFGNALVDLVQLASVPAGAHVLFLDQGDRTRRAQALLGRSTLWKGLPSATAGRIRLIPPFFPLAGVPSVWRFARLLAAALADTPSGGKG